MIPGTIYRPSKVLMTPGVLDDDGIVAKNLKSNSSAFTSDDRDRCNKKNSAAINL